MSFSPKYILVVPHYLIDNYGLIYYVRYDIWSRLLILSDFDRKDKEFHQLGDVFHPVDVADVRQIFYHVDNLYNLFTNVAGDTILDNPID
jgi:hypothetical protein